jgi:hypothetical protein
MGAGISAKARYNYQYRALKKVEINLHQLGIECHYHNLEVRGTHFVVYFAGCGPASNGESFCWLVLRYNPNQQPSPTRKTDTDIDYTDFHTRSIPSIGEGGFDAGIKQIGACNDIFSTCMCPPLGR